MVPDSLFYFHLLENGRMKNADGPNYTGETGEPGGHAVAAPKEDSAEKQRFSDLVKGCPRLTEKETYVLEQVYYWGYTAAELAPGMGTSKQNVNQIKLRALGKLRRQWETEK